ncbi:MAG: acyl--CoA ligase [bacterium]|nr:acyl--CoA ligase [bacterium]
MNQNIYRNNNIQENISVLFSGAGNKDRDFVVSGATYGRVYALAQGILEACGSTETVCLCAEDKSFIAAAFLASLAGGPALVIPYSLSAEVIGETAETVFCSGALVDKPRDLPGSVQAISAEPSTKDITLAFSRDIDSVFLKLFTGGSTGKPKVWSKSPANFFSEAFYLTEKFGISEDDIFAATVPTQHIYGILFSVLLPFVSFASVLEDVFTFPGEILSALEIDNATVFVGVPIHYRLLNGSTISNHSLKLAFSSAGPLNPVDGESFYKETGVGVTEVYGSTETGGIATRFRPGGTDALVPFDNVDWKIVDERLHVRSGFISPELPIDDENFFITGDRAELAGDSGSGFRLLGRADGVIKVAGKRVDLGDIQDKIKKLAGVRDVIVVSLPHDKGRENEIAALIESGNDMNSLKKSISSIVEPYAMPRRISIVDKMPVSAAGKYDRKKIIESFKN